MNKPTGSRALIIKQLTKVMQQAIERLDSPEAAAAIEAEVHRARQGGILDDKTACEMLRNIGLIRKEKGWASKITRFGGDNKSSIGDVEV